MKREQLVAYFAKRLTALGYDLGQRVHIPIAVAAAWVHEAGGPKMTSCKLGRMVNAGAIDLGIIVRDACNTHGRGLLWRPTDDPHDGVWYDLPERLARQKAARAADLTDFSDL